MTLNAWIEAQAGNFELSATIEADNELLVLFGRSGSGKSLTLKAIAGLLEPTNGHIRIGGKTVYDHAHGINLSPQERHVGYVIQELGLFPHLKVRDNILIGLENDTDAPARYEQLRALLSIEGLDSRRPHELSGGQQQRVALARALVRTSNVLLLDEPFSALDESLRKDLRSELLRLRTELQLSIVFVTHDLREAHLLADRIAVLDEGHILQFASREEVFRYPASRRVAELTGVTNLFEGEILGDRVVVAGLPLRVSIPPDESSMVDVAIRAERCVLRRIDSSSELPENCYVAYITNDLAFGNTHTLQLAPETQGPLIEIELAARPYEVLRIASQHRWVVELPASDLHVMSRSSPRAK